MDNDKDDGLKDYDEDDYKGWGKLTFLFYISIKK